MINNERYLATTSAADGGGGAPDSSSKVFCRFEAGSDDSDDDIENLIFKPVVLFSCLTGGLDGLLLETLDWDRCPLLFLIFSNNTFVLGSSLT